MADSAYRTQYLLTAQVPLETSVAAAEPVTISAGTTVPLIPKTPHKEPYPRINMNDADARRILTMFEFGNLEDILNYDIQPPKPANVSPYSESKAPDYRREILTGDTMRVTSPRDRHRRSIPYGKIASIGLGGIIVGAGLVALMIALNPGNVSQTVEGKKAAGLKKIEVPCDNIPQRAYGQGGVQYGGKTGPEFVCKPKDEVKISEYKPEFPKSPLILQYNVVEGDNLTRIVKNILVIKGGDERVERAAFLTAREIGKLNGIPEPYIIQPRQKLSVSSNLRNIYNGFLPHS